MIRFDIDSLWWKTSVLVPERCTAVNTNEEHISRRVSRSPSWRGHFHLGGDGIIQPLLTC
jgi:hypothetical protein